MTNERKSPYTLVSQAAICLMGNLEPLPEAGQFGDMVRLARDSNPHSFEVVYVNDERGTKDTFIMSTLEVIAAYPALVLILAGGETYQANYANIDQRYSVTITQV